MFAIILRPLFVQLWHPRSKVWDFLTSFWLESKYTAGLQLSDYVLTKWNKHLLQILKIICENKPMANWEIWSAWLEVHVYLRYELFLNAFQDLFDVSQVYKVNKSVASTTWYPATVLIFVVAHVLA